MIKIEHLVKQYGEKTVVNDISFTVNDGEIVGFLGPNGAGKSTTMNMITGYLSSTSGDISIDGFDILENTIEAKRHIGYLPEQPPLYLDMTVEEYMNFIYDLKGCTLNRKKHLNEIIDVTKLSDAWGRVIRNLSKGYKQRVGIAQALVGNPGTIILDEPTVGLDPKQVIEVRNLIRTLGRDHTIILSTHILSEVQAVCDRVLVMNKGKLVADERTEELVNAVDGNRRLSIKICGPQREVLAMLKNRPGIVYAEALGEHDLDSVTYMVESERGVDIRKPLFAVLAQNNWPCIGIEPMGINLEDVFLSLVDKNESAKSRKKRPVTPEFMTGSGKEAE